MFPSLGLEEKFTTHQATNHCLGSESYLSFIVPWANDKTMSTIKYFVLHSTKLTLKAIIAFCGGTIWEFYSLETPLS